jgi:hypothetical protein
MISIWPQRLSSLSVTVEARIRSRASLYWIFVGQSGNETGFSSHVSDFPCQCHSTNAPYTYFTRLPSAVYNHSDRCHLHYVIGPNIFSNINTVITRHKTTERRCECYMALSLTRRCVIARVTYVCRYDNRHTSTVPVV